MADKGPGSTGRSGNKRLARAKIKPTEHGIKSSKGRASAVEEKLSKTQQKKARQQKVAAVAIGVFAVIMALSMMLPSLTYIFGNNTAEPVEEQTQQQQSSDDTTADTSTATDELTDMQRVDASYSVVVDSLEAKLKENPSDLAALLNLGKNYVAWASEASAYATDDDGKSHVSELYDQAMAYYDRYLEINDDNAVRVSRAMCQLYSGDFQAAQEALESLTKTSPDYGPAWANLGLIYEYTGETEAAKAAYQKAVETDPNDEYGAKSYANKRLAAIAASSTALTSEDETTATTPTPADGQAALEEALGTVL